MTRTISTKRYILKIFIITILISLTTSASSLAQNSSPEDLLRYDMMLIADRYASQRWMPTEANVKHSSNVHTPDIEYCNDLENDMDTLGCWTPNTYSYGVPYAWNGASPINDSDLGLYRQTEGPTDTYFDEKILGDATHAPAAAGDIYTNAPDLPSTRLTAGVDCVGLIDNVWRLGIRAGTSAVSGRTRAIRFETLKRGDILMRFLSGDRDNHVILFDQFIFDEPGVTKIRVYESTKRYRKVVQSIWRVVGTPEDYLDANGLVPTHKVTLERVQVNLGVGWQEGDHLIQAGYIPRTFIQPRDIVLVIDNSGSMGQEDRIVHAKTQPSNL